jgi:hypothetical protein
MPALLSAIACVIVVVVVFGLPMSGLGIIPPIGAATVIRIRDGRLSVQRGSLRIQVRDDVQEVLAAGGLRTGFIAITRDGRVHFSRSIPPALHQRLRSVLLN